MLLRAAGLVPVASMFLTQAPSASAVEWRLDNLERIGGHPVTVVGAPRVVTTARGDAIEFIGATDGVFVDSNPVAGLRQFTIEVLFEPAADGPDEQRFFHIEEAGATETRALMETRMLPGKLWSLDTYLRWKGAGVTLLDRAKTHPASIWHTAALTYDGATMTHFVNGVRELSNAVSFGVMGPGTTSIGVRQTKTYWFKGRIQLIRITPEALPPDRLMK
jgi:hypothetical protein